MVLTVLWPASSFKPIKEAPSCRSRVRQLWRRLRTVRPGFSRPALWQSSLNHLLRVGVRKGLPWLSGKRALAGLGLGGCSSRYACRARVGVFCEGEQALPVVFALDQQALLVQIHVAKAQGGKRWLFRKRNKIAKLIVLLNQGIKL